MRLYLNGYLTIDSLISSILLGADLEKFIRQNGWLGLYYVGITRRNGG